MTNTLLRTKILKILITVLFTAVIITALFMMTEFSSSAETHSGKCGTNLTWSLDTSTGVLDITGSGNMYDSNGFRAPWYDYESYIKSVVIGDSVTSIGA